MTFLSRHPCVAVVNLIIFACRLVQYFIKNVSEINGYLTVQGAVNKNRNSRNVPDIIYSFSHAGNVGLITNLGTGHYSCWRIIPNAYHTRLIWDVMQHQIQLIRKQITNKVRIVTVVNTGFFSRHFSWVQIEVIYWWSCPALLATGRVTYSFIFEEFHRIRLHRCTDSLMIRNNHLLTLLFI